MSNNILFDIHRERPEKPLIEKSKIEDCFNDRSRKYIKIFTSMYAWEFFMLADYLRQFIETSRNNVNNPVGKTIKKDYRSRLYYTLYWLHSGCEYRMIEFYYGWSKSQVEKDIKHILKAIIRGLDNLLLIGKADLDLF